jgi:hypothetical protein
VYIRNHTITLRTGTFKESILPFISIQSFNRRVAAIVNQTVRRITNWMFDDVDTSYQTQIYGYTAISDNGQYMVVAGDASTNTVDSPGVVYVYRRDTGPNTPWVLEQELIPTGVVPDPGRAGPGYSYGWRDIAISGDGTRVAFGCSEGNTLTNDQGAIYVFRRVGGSPAWVQEAKLVNSVPVYSFNPITFNTGTGVNSATDTITLDSVHGMNIAYPYLRRYKNNGGVENIGLVNDALYWVAAKTTTALTIFSDDVRPYIVGAFDPLYDNFYPGRITLYSGTWYRCILQNTSPAVAPPNATYWEVVTDTINITATGSESHALEETLGANSPSYGEQGTVALDVDGDTLITNNFMTTGSKFTVAVWTRSGTTWSLQQNVGIVASNDVDDGATTELGSVALSDDGNTFAVGRWHPTTYPSYDKEVGIYTRAGSTWTQEAFVIPPPTAIRTDWYAIAGLKLSGNGDILAVGDPLGSTQLDSDRSLSDQGYIYVYERTASPTWAIVQTIAPRPTEDTQFLGQSIAITPDGSRLASGAYFYGDVFPNSAPYLYYSTNGAGQVSSTLLDPAIVGLCGFSPSGTFTITSASDPGFVGTPAVIEYTSTDGFITALNIISPGSGYTPNLVNDLVNRTTDAPQLSNTNAKFWPDLYNGTPSAITSWLFTNGWGAIYVFDRNGSTYNRTDIVQTLSCEYGELGQAVDISADGKIITATAPDEEYRSYLRITNQNPTNAGMGIVIEEYDIAPTAYQTRHHASYIISPNNDATAGYLPPAPPPTDSIYGYHHKMSDDGSTIVVGDTATFRIQVWYGSNNGETWAYGDELIPNNLPTLNALLNVDISADGTKVIAYYRYGGNSNCAVCTWTRSGSPPVWTERPVREAPITARSDELNYLGEARLSGDGQRLFISESTPRNVNYGFNISTGVNSTTDVITFASNHPFTTGMAVNYTKQSQAGTIGIVDGALLYARYIAANQITLHSTYSGAVDDTSRTNLTASGTSTTHYFYDATMYNHIYICSVDGGTGGWIYENTDDVVGAKSSTYNFGDAHVCNYDGTLLFTTSAQRVEAAVAPNQGNRDRTVTVWTREPGSPINWIPTLKLNQSPYYIDFSGPTWTSSTRIECSDTGAVAVLADQELNHVYVLERDDYTTGAYVWKQMLRSSTPLTDVGFGGSRAPDQVTNQDENFVGTVRGADVSADGSTIVVGAWKTTVSGNVRAGGIYVFRKVNNVWRQEQYIPTPCPSVDAGFGRTVCVSSDGSLVSVASPEYGVGPGHVDVYSIIPPSADPGCPPVFAPEELFDTMVLRTTINSETSTAQEQVGRSVSMSVDGLRMVVGGATPRIYINACDGWILEQDLELPGSPAPNLASRIADDYGASVAINDNGDTVVVGAPNTDVGAGTDNGAIHIFNRTGSSWTHQGQFAPAGLGNLAHFGRQVAIYGDEIILAICDEVSTPGRGYVYRKVTGVWTLMANSIIPPIAITNTGSIAYAYNGIDRGTVVMSAYAAPTWYVWTYDHVYDSFDNTPIDTFTQVGQITSTSGNFGMQQGTLKISSDGSHIVVADPWVPLYVGQTEGQVYVYQNTNGTSNNYNPAGPWTLIDTITPPNLGRLPIFESNNSQYPLISFGWAVCVSPDGGKILVASYDFSPPDVINSFNAQIFFGGSAWVLQKQLDNTYYPLSDQRIFPPGPNAQTVASADCDANMYNVVLGGDAFKHSTLVSGDPELDSVGVAQVFQYTPTSTAPHYAYTDTAMLEDYDTGVIEGQYYGEGSHTLSRDGNTVAVTYAYGVSTLVDVFVRGGSPLGWIWQQTVDVGTTVGLDRIHLSDNGDVMVCQSSGSSEFATATRTAGVWTVVDLFSPLSGSPAADNVYGFEFHLSGDGLTLFVTTSSAAGVTTIFVYTWNAGTTSWNIQDSSTISGANVLDYYWLDSAQEFGNGLSSSYDGNWFVTTGLRWTDFTGADYHSPCAYIFHRIGSTWSLHSIVPGFIGSHHSTYLGQEMRVRMTSDGSKFVITNAILNRAFVFVRDFNTDRHWNVDAILTYEGDDLNIGWTGGDEKIGAYWSTEISDSGNVVVAGAWNFNSNAGRVLVWRKVDGQWRFETPLYNSASPASGLYFGYSLATDALGKTITVSDNFTVNADGVLWVYEKTLDAMEMQPFPFLTYAIDGDSLVETAPLSGAYTGHYYNDPALDGVQFNVRLCGESWEDVTHDVRYGIGLFNSDVSPVRVTGLVRYSTTEVLDFGTGLLIDGPHAPIYRASSYAYGGTTTPSPIPRGTYVYPGVASSQVWRTLADYIEVPVYGGKPVSFEAWYSDNQTKTNPAVGFSGYTHFGDSGQSFPDWHSNVDGYVRRYVAGIIRADADLATLSVGDILYGIMFNGTPTSGEGYIVVNGLIVGNVQTNYKPTNVWGFAELSMNTNISDFGNYAQTFTTLEVDVNNFANNSLLFAGLNPPTPGTPFDTYNVKWAWYLDFVPDAGFGTYAGQVYCRMQTMYTHPGWPITGSP